MQCPTRIANCAKTIPDSDSAPKNPPRTNPRAPDFRCTQKEGKYSKFPVTSVSIALLKPPSHQLAIETLELVLGTGDW